MPTTRRVCDVCGGRGSDLHPYAIFPVRWEAGVPNARETLSFQVCSRCKEFLGLCSECGRLGVCLVEKDFPGISLIGRMAVLFRVGGGGELLCTHCIVEKGELRMPPEDQVQKKVNPVPEKLIHKDSGKLPVGLVPPEAIEALARVLEFGSLKYEPRGWESGMEWSRIYASALRHLLKWGRKEDVDSESGLPHIEHALCNLAFLVTYAIRGVGEDDRPKYFDSCEE